VAKAEQVQGTAIPEGFNFLAIPQLRAEARQKLAAIQPRNLGQASRISGITPADIAVVMMYLKQASKLAT